MQADVGSKTLGYLDAVLVDRGDRVRRGQILALVRPSDLPDQLAAARSTLAQAQSSAALARTNYERAKALAPAGGRVAAGAAAGAGAAGDRGGGAAGGAGADRGAGGAPGRDAHHLAAHRRGRAAPPRSGDAGGPAGGRRHRDRGARRRAARVHHRQRARAGRHALVGKDAHVELDALPGRTFSGKVVRLSPTLDPATRTLDAEVQLDNRSGELYAGHVRAGRDRRRGAPEGARWCRWARCVLSDRKAYAFVVDAGARSFTGARSTLGVDGGDWFEVKTGSARGRRGRGGGRRGAGRRHEDPRRARPVARGAAADAGPAEDADDVADAAGAAKPDLHPDDVADDRRAGLRVAAPAQRRPVPGDQRPRHPRVDLLPGRRARPTSRRPSRSPSSARSARRPGVDRVESISRQGFSSSASGSTIGVNLDNAQFEVSQRVAQILNTLPPGHPAAVHPQVRHHQHPGRPGRDQRRRARRAAALRPRLQHRRAAARAHPRRRQRQRGGRQVREIEVEVKRDALRARGLGILDVVDAVRAVQPAAAERQPQGGRLATTTSSPTPRSPTPRPLGDVIVRAGRRRGRDGTGRRRCGSATSPRSRTASADQSEIVRLNGQRGRVPARAQAAGREHHRGGRRDPRGAAEPARRAAQRAPGHLVRPVALHPVGGERARARGGLGRAAGGAGDPDLPRQPARDRDHRRRHPAVDHGDVRPAVLHAGRR